METVIFILPLIITIAGYVMNKYPPKKVNWFIGYRTRKSMQDEKVWKKANEYCGKLWIKIGVIMLVVAVILYALIYLKTITISETWLAVIILFEICPLLLSSIMVENKIKSEK